MANLKTINTLAQKGRPPSTTLIFDIPSDQAKTIENYATGVLGVHREDLLRAIIAEAVKDMAASLATARENPS